MAPARLATRWREIALLAAFLAVSGAALGQPRIVKYQELKKAQKWAAALDIVREEIASPAIANDKQLLLLRIIGVGAAADLARYLGTPAGLDEEVARYVSEGKRYDTADEDRQGLLRNVHARYFSFSGRNGRALPIVREGLEFWKKRGNELQVFLALDALASAYGDMGELPLRSHYRLEALQVAEKYFAASSRNKPTPYQWLQYKLVLDKHMDNLVGGGASPEELDRFWPTARDIAARYTTPKSLAFVRATKYYAMAGSAARAQALLSEARQVFAKEAASLDPELRDAVRMDIVGAAAHVDLYAGRHAQAATGFEAVLRHRDESGRHVLDTAIHRLYGQALEQAGELAAARAALLEGIRGAERARESYSVAERTAFFRSAMRKTYHGLIRVSARQASAARDIEPFWEAVQASEMVRARQLGDLVAPGAPPLLLRETLETIRSGLGPSRAVLYFTTTDDSLVVLAFTDDRHVAAVVPLEANFANSLRAVARDLARADSPMAGIESGLTDIGRRLLAPVADIVKSRSELIVLPDGVMNLVPFDLLSVEAPYRPLAETHRVRIVPSLRFAGRALQPVKSSGLLAFADPAYKKPASLAGVEAAEFTSATRGSRFLDYFAPLPETRAEADAIRRLFAGAKADAFYGAQATESAVKRADFSQYSFLHFATHGILGEEVPGIGEPALVLADEPGEDGFLTASEIAALKMNARLAVLSACNTGSGEYVSGEGVMGLSRAFLIAGSRAVVVSLWPVASKATERLMVAFYANLRDGEDPHEALRKAKLGMRDQARAAAAGTQRALQAVPSGSAVGDPSERHPFFWAPFIVVGG